MLGTSGCRGHGRRWAPVSGTRRWRTYGLDRQYCAAIVAPFVCASVAVLAHCRLAARVGADEDEAGGNGMSSSSELRGGPNRKQQAGSPSGERDNGAGPRPGGRRGRLANLRLVGARIPSEIQRRDTVFRRLLGLADAVAASSALLLTVAISARDHLEPAAALAPLAVVVMSKVFGLYDRDELVLNKSTLDEAPGVFRLATLFAILVWLLESRIVVGAFSKTEFVLLWVATFVGVLACRAGARWLAGRLSAPERCLLLGPPEACELVDAKLALRRGTGAHLVGREDLEDARGAVIRPGGLEHLMQAYQAHRVILAPRAIDSDAVLDLIREAKAIGVKISILPRFSEVLGSSVTFDELHGVTLLAVRKFGLSRSSRALKRSFDLAVASLFLVAAAPFLMAFAIAIKFDSRGPVLFRQTRVGRVGRRFEILKFRTMVEEADEHRAELEYLNEAKGLFKIADDPRVTRFGRWLRRLSLDEMPQLLNVLKGDMSIVGPRPLVIEDDERIVGWHRRRLDMMPGMTGHWQVLGSSRVPLEEMVAIDYLYVANWSLWADLKYLIRTIPHVLARRGL
jgi:exopolysaccharide biosynthesis polyprenyl glycosylphosphotransferase